MAELLVHNLQHSYFTQITGDCNMKCPQCWAEKAYQRRVSDWKWTVLRWFLFVPMQCHHCYHKFSIFRLTAWGKKIDAPHARVVPLGQIGQPSYAMRCQEAGRDRPAPSAKAK